MFIYEANTLFIKQLPLIQRPHPADYAQGGIYWDESYSLAIKRYNDHVRNLLVYYCSPELAEELEAKNKIGNQVIEGVDFKIDHSLIGANSDTRVMTMHHEIKLIRNRAVAIRLCDSIFKQAMGKIQL